MKKKKVLTKKKAKAQLLQTSKKELYKIGKLTITIKDGSGQLIIDATKVIVRDAFESSREYRAMGKSGEVTKFIFELSSGTYLVEINTDKFKTFSQSVRIFSDKNTNYEFFLTLKDPNANKNEKKGDAELLKGSFTWFNNKRLDDKNKFATYARQDALEYKKRMNDPEILNDHLNIESIKEPFSNSSFGNIGACVKVNWKNKNQISQVSLLAISYDLKKLGWVDENTLRVFEIDSENRYHLIKNSGVDIKNHYAYAHIDHSGTYIVIGLPKHPAVIETVNMFLRLATQLKEEKRMGKTGLKTRICQLILCASKSERLKNKNQFGAPEPPGGLGGSACDFCNELEIPEGGLPEGQLDPNGPVVTPGCNWLSIGPRNINGRIRAMAIHPANGNTLYVGSANAGVWVTGDAGESWKPLMHDQGALEIGALAVHLTNPANPGGDITIYAGTGEPTWWPGYAGIGILKSTDSGTTWSITGAIPAPGNDRFSAILIDPTSVSVNPNTTILYGGGTPGGLYKSTDGGGSWSLMLNKMINGLAMDPLNPAVIYSAVSFEGIFKYDPIMNVWNTFNTGLPTSFPQLIQISIGQSAPHTIYAKLDETVYKFDSSLMSWQSLGNHGGTTYGYWNNVLGVDPQDSNILFAGGIGFERTFDGGTTWHSIPGLHSDQHALAFDSSNHLNAYFGNDGGVYRGEYTSPSDLGTVNKVSDGLIITAFNQIGSSAAGPDVIGGGAQDNGTNRTVGGLTYDNIYGADGGFFVMDPANPYNLYAESQNGGIGKSINGAASWISGSGGFPGGPWITPIIIDPTSPAEPNRILFAGGNSQVYRSINSASSWTASSPNTGGSVNAIAIAPSSSAIVYSGSSNGSIWRSDDNGATVGNWKNITIGNIGGSASLPFRDVTDICVHPSNPDIVFITYSGLNGSTPGHVFRGTSADGWTTWKWDDLSSNLPNISTNAIQINVIVPDTIYVGTDIGVFYTINGGMSWTDFGDGLPNVVISDLALNALGNKLRAATYGYGMWQRDLDGSCPTVDVYVRDNKLDTGETVPSPSNVTDPSLVGSLVWWWESADIKIDAYPYFPADPLFDGVEFDLATSEDPVRNDLLHPNPNHLYVQVHNRGPLPAHNVKVKVLYADASAGLPALPSDFWTNYPNNWAAVSGWNIVNPLLPFQNIPELLPHTPKVLMWNWTVPLSANDHTCVLAVISADEDPVMRSDANTDDHLPWIVIPYDKHITLRNLHVITATAPFGGDSPNPLITFIDFHNALNFHQHFDIEIDLAGLPKGSKFNMLLPKVQTQISLIHKMQNGVEVTNVSGKESWWDKTKNILKKEWYYNCRLDETHKDPCTGGKIVNIPRILIPSGKKMKAALILSLPSNCTPGSIYKFIVLQRQGNLVVGGSTYEIRIPPTEIIVK